MSGSRPWRQSSTARARCRREAPRSVPASVPTTTVFLLMAGDEKEIALPASYSQSTLADRPRGMPITVPLALAAYTISPAIAGVEVTAPPVLTRHRRLPVNPVEPIDVAVIAPYDDQIAGRPLVTMDLVAGRRRPNQSCRRAWRAHRRTRSYPAEVDDRGIHRRRRVDRPGGFELPEALPGLRRRPRRSYRRSCRTRPAPRRPPATS